MDCNARIKHMLTEAGISFEEQSHDLAYTAQRVAESEHLSGWGLAKVVIGLADTRLLMFVVPTPVHLNLRLAAQAAGVDDVQLATEAEFESAFPDCDVGAMPPFGTMYDLPTYIDSSFAETSDIVFQAGTHTETVKMKTADYLRLSGASVVELAPRAAVPKA
jgi:Ala-tRNA(Pro) deacylase